MTKDEALKQWLEALEHLKHNAEKSGANMGLALVVAEEAIDTIRTAIEEAEKQEPYGWVSQHTVKGPYEWQFNKERSGVYPDNAISILPVYTTPPAAPVQEPVAWMVDVDLANYQGQSEYRTILAWNAKPVWSGTHEINEVLKAVPLYTTPPAQEFVCSTGLCHYKAQPALKPLTNEQVGKAARDAHIAFCLNKHQTYEHALTRAVEAAHGITGETK